MVKTETGKILIKNNGIDFFLPKPDLYKLLFSCMINEYELLQSFWLIEL